ncbi:3,4-dihydroxy-2-butanone 4-phosphate synthase / GTP cyclohydrolase II [hydrothermal vent metagenome]|uniref:3,4-dihydroxy-2-butanone 4-phosphate synthase / GTP cyclohydrolase II n=1 Tax=hydrothermal vent metagenome TaxID=652676 RepID=A0A1W1BVH7_9ZZZZ
MKHHNIEEILEDYKQGKMIILMDDEDRENEGDLIIASEKVTPEAINFMATFGRGLICQTMTEERCQQLNLPLMVSKNTETNHTNFTVSIEAAKGVTTGISATDRATTVLTAIKKNATAKDIVQPGHIFPLMAKPGGVLNRAGHTEAGCDLARLSGFEPSSVIVEILNEDGSMARRDDLEKFSEKHNIKFGTVADLIRYRVENEKTIKRIDENDFSSEYGEFRLISFVDTIYGEEHLALVKGKINQEKPTIVRVHMENTITDVIHQKNKQLKVSDALRFIDKNGGVFVLLRKRKNSVDDDVKTYGLGAQILADIGVGKMRVLGSPRKLMGLKGFGLSVVEYIEKK